MKKKLSISIADQELTSIFNQLLGRDDISLKHNLLHEGINSIQSVAAAMLLREKGIIIRPQQLLLDAPIREIIAESISETNTPQENTNTSNSPYPFTPTQQSWQKDGFLKHYNVYSGWEFKKDQIQIENLDLAIKRLCEEQEELKLRIYDKNDKICQCIAQSPENTGLEIIDVTDQPHKDRRDYVSKLTAELQHSFTFSEDQKLYRFIAFILDEQGNGIIFILVHHYMVDGFGFNVLVKKLSELYQEVQNNTPTDFTKLGSGSAKLWSDRLNQYAQEEAINELTFWQKLPWSEIKNNFKSDSSIQVSQNLFNEDDAAKLHQYQHGSEFPTHELHDIFKSQATVIDYLDTNNTQKLFNHNWGLHTFNDFDLFSYAVSQALRPHIKSDVIWLDMISAARNGIFDELDLSSSVGYISELIPYLMRYSEGEDYQSGATSIRQFLDSSPRTGIGLRALKYLNHTPEIQDMVQEMTLPEVGINYSASIQHTISNNLLDLPSSNEWFGPTLDENGIRYKFWFRIYYNNGRLEILMRYDPKHYLLETALDITANIKKYLVRYLADLENGS